MRKCLDLADRLFCRYFIENPESGLPKTRGVVAGLPYRVVDCCVYADERFAHRARKRTALWTARYTTKILELDYKQPIVYF